MDARRHELNPDAPRSGWRYRFQVAWAWSEFWWVPALAVVVVVLVVKGLA